MFSIYLPYNLRHVSVQMRRYKTIYALSSGSLPSAIAVVRISGSRSKEVLKRLTEHKNIEPMKLFFSKLRNEEGEVLDHAMACFMKGPKTFTGEDCAELYLHGSKAVVNATFAALAEFPDLQSAKAGEFSKRAFYNNKMNVLQVEALAGLISAETEGQRILALRHLKSSKYLHNLRTEILDLSARLEAAIDFGEEMAPEATISDAELRQAAENIRRKLSSLRHSADRGTLIRSGIQVALVGKTNVGKSSIMNRLAEKDVAIVSDIPGTTRDSLQLRLQLCSNIANFMDTAGIRETTDILEQEGIRRSIQRAEEANIIILVVDKHELKTVKKDVDFLLSKINFSPMLQSLIICINKSDLFAGTPFSILNASQYEKIPDVQAFGLPRVVWTSCHKENGLDNLIGELTNLVTQKLNEDSFLKEDGTDGNDLILSGNRQVDLLKRALIEIEHFLEVFIEQNDLALAVQHLRECAIAIGEISGGIVNHEVMERIFSTMCVGK